jgi:hypothetical protein
MRIYIDTNDQWIGRYRGPNHNYICIIPCIVIRLRRKRPQEPHPGYRKDMLCQIQNATK